MTREEYILHEIAAAKERINITTAKAGMSSDWNSSWNPTSIFPQIFDGILSESFGQIYDQSAQITALATRLEDYRAKINEIVTSYDELLVNIKATYPSWNIPTVDRMI